MNSLKSDVSPWFASCSQVPHIAGRDKCTPSFGITVEQSASFRIPQKIPEVVQPKSDITHCEHGVVLAWFESDGAQVENVA